MRINVYAEELTEHVETVETDAECGHFIGIRFYVGGAPSPTGSSVTLWAEDAARLRGILRRAIDTLPPCPHTHVTSTLAAAYCSDCLEPFKVRRS